MGYTTNPLIVRIFINRNENGWSERIPIIETDWNLALPIALQLVQARSRILSAGAVIEYATLAMAESPWWEQALITDPLLPLPQWNFDNADSIGLFWHFEADGGQSQGRLFRAIENGQIQNNQWVGGPKFLPPGIPPLPADLTTATKSQLFSNCFATFREIEAISRKVGEPVAGVQNYRISPVVEAHFDRVRSRNVGGPYKRQSWECVPYAYAPPFSPCGEVTGVGRRAFTAQCRFYPGGPVRWIRYYWAKCGSLVFQGPQIFWGRFRAQEIYNTYGPGELTGNARRVWSPGYEFGNADGMHLSGPAAGFLGQYTPDFPPSLPTPVDQLPVCDLPLFAAGEVCPGNACLGSAEVFPVKVA
jgi:hypothetical protein